MDMNKNRQIEEQFLAYFDGLPAPNVDLIAVKRAVRTERGNRSRARRRGVVSLVSVCACLLVLIVFAVNFLPSLFVGRYSLANASTTTLSFSEVNDRYSDQAGFLAPFSLADNATASYTLYSADEQDVLLRADVGMWKGLSRLEASVYIDLSNGRYVADELKGYDKLPSGGGGFRSETYELENGEYGMRAYCEGTVARYFVDAESRDPDTFRFLLSLMQEI